jgi:hypothetical protein
MQIIVNHLTRMQPGYICVAGIDVSTKQHVRPVLRGRLTTDWLAVNGGPFDIASLVDLGPVEYWGQVPEVEDYHFSTMNARCTDVISPTRFWELLQQVAQKSLVELFGPDIKPFKRGCVVAVGTGKASLGCLIPALPPQLYVSSYDGKIRMLITDGSINADVSVTDLRLCETDHKTAKEDVIRQVNKRMWAGVALVLSVGLTRPWKQSDDTLERHWLQVNNIHLKDNPVWRLE